MSPSAPSQNKSILSIGSSELSIELSFTFLFNPIRFDAIRCGLFCFGRLTNPSESGIRYVWYIENQEFRVRHVKLNFMQSNRNQTDFKFCNQRLFD